MISFSFSLSLPLSLTPSYCHQRSCIFGAINVYCVDVDIVFLTALYSMLLLLFFILFLNFYKPLCVLILILPKSRHCANSFDRCGINIQHPNQQQSVNILYPVNRSKSEAKIYLPHILCLKTIHKAVLLWLYYIV